MVPMIAHCRNACLVMALGCGLTPSASAQFTDGNVVVYEVGTLGVYPSNGSAIVLREFTPEGSPAWVLNIPTTGPDAMVGAASLVGGGMSLTPAGDRLVFPGYVDFSAQGVGLATTSGSEIPRAVGTVDAAGNFVRVFTSTTLFSGTSILSVASDGTDFWGVGNGGGVAYFGPGPQTVVTADTSSSSHIAIAGGQLSKRGNNAVPEENGIYDIGTGLPTTGGQPQTLFIDVSQVPPGFQFNAARDVCYVSAFGVQKWTLINNTWSLAYTLPLEPSGIVQQLCVDFTGEDPVIYGITLAPTRLWKWVDAGAPSDATQLATTIGIWSGISLAPGTPISTSVPSSTVSMELRAWPDPVRGDQLFFNREVDATVLDALGQVVAVVHHTDHVPVDRLLPGCYLVRTADGSVLRFVRE